MLAKDFGNFDYIRISEAQGDDKRKPVSLVRSWSGQVLVWSGLGLVRSWSGLGLVRSWSGLVLIWSGLGLVCSWSGLRLGLGLGLVWSQQNKK